MSRKYTLVFIPPHYGDMRTGEVRVDSIRIIIKGTWHNYINSENVYMNNNTKRNIYLYYNRA